MAGGGPEGLKKLNIFSQGSTFAVRDLSELREEAGWWLLLQESFLSIKNVRRSINRFAVRSLIRSKKKKKNQGFFRLRGPPAPPHKSETEGPGDGVFRPETLPGKS